MHALRSFNIRRPYELCLKLTLSKTIFPSRSRQGGICSQGSSFLRSVYSVTLSTEIIWNTYDITWVSISISSVTQSCMTLCNPMDCSTPGLPVHHQLPEFTQTHVHWVSDAIQPSHPLSSPSPPTFNLSQHQGLFKWVSSLHQMATSIGVSASTSVLPMNIQDWFSLGWNSWISLNSKGLKSLLQHHSSKASILWCSAFFTVQFSHPYMTTGKTIALTIWTFVSKVISLFFNMLSRFVIAFWSLGISENPISHRLSLHM